MFVIKWLKAPFNVTLYNLLIFIFVIFIYKQEKCEIEKIRENNIRSQEQELLKLGFVSIIHDNYSLSIIHSLSFNN